MLASVPAAGSGGAQPVQGTANSATKPGLGCSGHEEAAQPPCPQLLFQRGGTPCRRLVGSGVQLDDTPA